MIVSGREVRGDEKNKSEQKMAMCVCIYEKSICKFNGTYFGNSSARTFKTIQAFNR